MAFFDNFYRDYRKLNKLIKNNDISGIVSYIEGKEKNEIIEELLEEKYGVSSEKFLRIFDKSGNIMYNSDDIILTHELVFNSKIRSLMVRSDLNWKDNFSDIQRDYISFSLTNSVYDNILNIISYSNTDEFLKKYFNHGSLTKEFYDDIFSIYFSDNCKSLLKDPELSKNCSNIEIGLLNMPDDAMNQYGDFVFYNYAKNNIIKREDIEKYFDGKSFTEDFYGKAIFIPELSNQIYEDLNKYKKNYNEIQLAFIEKFHGDYNMLDLFSKNGINSDTLNDFFMIENNQLQLRKSGFRILYDNKAWNIISNFNISDNKLDEYGINSREIFLFDYYKKLGNEEYRKSFLKILTEKKEIMSFTDDELNEFLELFNKISMKLDKSNSSEMVKFKGDIILQLMSVGNPDESLNLIDDVYSKNNLPDIGKSYLVFKILHSDYSKFNLDDESLVSPILKNINGDYKRDIVIFSDLLKCALGSNNRSVRNYLMNIKEGNELFLNISNGKITLEKMNDDEKEVLKIFTSHLNTLYNNSKEGKIHPKKLLGDLEKDLDELMPMFSTTDRYNLPDRIVRMFGYYAGLKSFDDALNYLNARRDYADKKGRINAHNIMNGEFNLKVGDFVKGLNDINYLPTILQNGSVAKEFLCVGASSDSTPLDTDLSYITNECNNLNDSISSTIASNYGPIWFALKNDNRFTITRDQNGEKDNYNVNKLEAFQTLKKGHYGIRTGFSSSDVDYIIVDNVGIDNLLPQIKHYIALNGFYIPVVDKNNGKLVFAPDEYDNMRQKMSGLKQYGAGDFIFSDNLLFDKKINDIVNNIDDYINDANNKRSKIYEVVAKVLNESGLDFKDKFDYDISLGNAQLIDTGSTGRGTSTGKSSDFDFILRIDSNVNKKEIRKKLIEAFNASSEDMSNLRMKNINIDGLDESIDIDISFVKKSETNYYSTDNALKDRLEQIKKQDYNKYKEVIANIIYAKEFLKENHAYKPEHSRDQKEGGLGGVGVENWILQNGGSFLDAARSFYETAKGKSFEMFKKEYKVWDDGINFYTGKFDEFVSSNMTEKGYNKMVDAIEKFLNKIKTNEMNSNSYSFTNSRNLVDTDDFVEEQTTSRGR